MRAKVMIVSAALFGTSVAGCSKDEAKPAVPATPTVAAAAARPTNTPGGREDLVVWADAEPDSGPAPLTVKFSADPLEAMQEPRYAWNFGDGSPEGAGVEVAHTYTKPGNYTVTLTVSDNTGNTGTDQTPIEVEQP